jgi:D-amino-acid dehydrogenase
MPRPVNVAVVGGGVVGLACAHALARQGARVVVYDRDRVGHGCSYGNTGWICPGLSAPLPAPGVMGAAMLGMLRRRSPVRISPVVGPSFLRWSWLFWRACAPERYRAGLEATVTLTKTAVADLADLRNAGVEFELYETGMVVGALTEAGLEEYAAMLRDAEAAGYEGPVRVLDAQEARELEPAVGEAVIGAVHAPSEQYVRPESLSGGLAAALRVLGAEIREGAEVTDLRELETDAVVLAAGAWSGSLLGRLGVRIPMEAAKGYSVTARGRGTPPRAAYYLAEARVGASTFGDELRIAGVFDLTGLDLTLRRKRIEMILRDSRPYFRDWEPERVELEWTGLRPYPADGLPILGRVPGHERLFLATGHGRLGITMAPTTGKLLASVILDGASPPELEPFGIDRFLR